MKYALSLDHLLERQEMTAVADIFCELYPEAEAYCVAHQPGAVLGAIEIRKIHSTGLSTKVRSPEQLSRHGFLVPTMVQQLYVPCSVDVVFNVSLGLSHGIPKCEDSYQVTYLYDDYFFKRVGGSIRERLFTTYLKKWSRKNLAQVNELWVSTERLKNELAPHYKGEIQVVAPFIKLSEFPLIPSSLFKHDFYLIKATPLKEKQANAIVEFLNKRETRFRFIGEDSHLSELKKSLPEDAFFGDRCAGELAPLMSSSRGLIDLTQEGFPTSSIQAQACGRPCIGMARGSAQDFHLSPYVHKVSSVSGLPKALDQLEESLESLEPKKVRAYAMEHHDLKFKGFLKRRMDDLAKGPKTHSEKTQELS